MAEELTAEGPLAVQWERQSQTRADPGIGMLSSREEQLERSKSNSRQRDDGQHGGIGVGRGSPSGLGTSRRMRSESELSGRPNTEP